MQIYEGTSKEKVRYQACGIPKAATAFKWTGRRSSRVCRKCENNGVKET